MTTNGKNVDDATIVRSPGPTSRPSSSELQGERRVRHRCAQRASGAARDRRRRGGRARGRVPARPPAREAPLDHRRDPAGLSSFGVGGVLVRLARTGLRKGVFEGRRGWLVDGRRRPGSLASRGTPPDSRAQLVFAQELKPGEGWSSARCRPGRSRPPGATGSLAPVKVLLRNPRRELEVPGPMTRRRAARSARAEPRVGARDPRATRSSPATPASPTPTTIEIRPVISGGCRREVPASAAAPAVIDVRRHNAAFCRDHFLHHCRGAGAPGDRRVHEMIGHGRAGPRRRVGRQGLARALGPARSTLGYDADGLYLGLGIGEYSRRVAAATPRRSPRRAA